MLLILCVSLYSIYFPTDALKIYNKIQILKHFKVLPPDCHLQGVKEYRGSQVKHLSQLYLKWNVRLVTVFFRLPEDFTRVPKHVGVISWFMIYYLYFILLSEFLVQYTVLVFICFLFTYFVQLILICITMLRSYYKFCKSSSYHLFHLHFLHDFWS
jgi:hypothetical protein